MKTGIWLDKRRAIIIRVSETDTDTTTMESLIEDFNPVGGSRSNVPYGPVDTVSEHKYLERKKHQETRYFDRIIENVRLDKEILIFGPAQTKNQLSNRISMKKNIGLKILGCLQADSMTENQIVAFVKEFYGLIKRKTV